MHPMKIHIKANNHSGCRSGVKQTCGRLYKVIQDHINPKRVSPMKEKNTLAFFLDNFINLHLMIL